MERREALIVFIRQSLKGEFDPESDELLARLDSVSLLQLVLFIEERFEIELDMGNFDLENFRTVDALMSALQQLK